VKGRQALAISALVFVAVLIGTTMLLTGGDDNKAVAAPMPPQAVNRIAQKNDNAAVTAAAQMRERSARDARIADAIQDQQDSANAAR